MKKIFTTMLIAGSAIGFALAQPTTTAAPGSNLLQLLGLAQTIVSRLVPFLIGLAVVSLFYGIVMFMWKGRDKAEDHDKWMKWMGYSILAIFVMVSVWGLIGFLGQMLGIGQGGQAPAPTIPMPTS